MGVNASYLGGNNKQDLVLNFIKNGGLQILYITPEMYSTCPIFFDQIRQRRFFILALMPEFFL